MNTIKILLLILFLLFQKTVVSQEPFFRQVPLTGVVANHKINAICMDHRKVIWLGTSEGIFRFAGNGFEKLTFQDSLNPGDISSLSGVAPGGILIGNKAGKLFSYSNETLKLVNTGSIKINTAISGIVVSATGETWFSTLGDGIFHISKTGVKQYTSNDGLADNYTYCMVADSLNNIWTGSDGGLSKVNFKNGKINISKYTTDNGLRDNIIRQLELGKSGNIGIGTEEKGFCVFDTAKESFYNPPAFSNWNYGPVTSIVMLENEFWIGTSKSGIIDYEFQGYKRTRYFNKSSGFDGSNVNCMFRDHEGNVWIGAGSELYFSPGEKIEFKSIFEKVHVTNIRTILADKNENIWFSNDSALYFYSSFLQNEIQLNQPLKNTPFERMKIISLYQDYLGYVWMGTFDNGVLRFDPIKKTGKIFSTPEGLVNPSVLSIDGVGNEIWFATLGGVSRYSISDSSLSGNGIFKSYNEENGLGNNFIYKVFADSKKRIWFATDGEGITKYADGVFINYNEKDGLYSKVIYSITEDRSGKIWLSSANDGVYSFDGTSFKNFSVPQGLTDINISALETDQFGNIIIIHKKGIDAIDPVTNQIISFGSEVGVTTIDPDINAIDSDKLGNVWIGTRDGVIKLALDKSVGKIVPQLFINNILCFLEKVDTTSANVFSHNQNHISFDYMAIWYSDPQVVTYQYKLEGYNNEWVTTRDRFITFPNLRPGNYKFRLKSSINGNFINSNEISYSFLINLPIWQRTWFIVIATLAVIFLIVLYIRHRDKRMKSLERLKKEKIESQYEILKNQVNPHFLFNSFNTLINIIDSDKDVAIEYVNKLSDFFRNILSYRERDLISIREELELVETYIFLQQKRYGNNFKVSLNIPADIRDKYGLPTLALQIVIENCIKHNAVSIETPVVVEVFAEENNYLVVRNNINEKLLKEPSTGIGIQNLRNRYRIAGKSEIILEVDTYFYVVKLPLILINRPQ